MPAHKAEKSEKKIGTWNKEVRRFLRKELGGCEDFGKLFDLAPSWVKKIIERLEASINRGYNLREDSEDQVFKLGIVAGHFAAWSEASFKAPKEVGKSVPKLKKMLKELPTVISPVQKHFAKLSEEIRVIMNKQPAMIHLRFNSGYERAMQKRIYTGKEPGFWETSSTKIYILLLLMAPIMPRIKSVAMLDKILSSVPGLWKSSDPKRLQKLCQRIGLTFRKPGSPPEAERAKSRHPTSSPKFPRP
jgi:hypothetical protein